MKLTKLIILTIIVSLVSCQTNTKPLILISKDYNKNIEDWLKNIDSNITTKVFYTIPLDSMDYYLHNTKGIIIGGGEDINPKLYNYSDNDNLCETPDNYRDSIENLMIKFAMNSKIPLLGICRGNQIMNAVNGGTLIPDIPTFYPNSNIKHRGKTSKDHFIIPQSNSWIEKELNYDTIWVNSRHHQAVDKIAPQFMVSAYSPDSVIESIEVIDKRLHPFAIGIQWHPEGLNDSISYQIGKIFISSCAN